MCGIKEAGGTDFPGTCLASRWAPKADLVAAVMAS